MDATETQGKFEFRPLEPGYGITIGNSLRRILLNSLEGFAITSVSIEGIDHEFSTIKGVVEDVTEMILNLKQVRFKQQIEDEDNEQVFILRYYADCKAYILETQTPYWTDKTAYYTLDNAAAAIGEQCSVFYLTFEPSTQAA